MGNTPHEQLAASGYQSQGLYEVVSLVGTLRLQMKSESFQQSNADGSPTLNVVSSQRHRLNDSE